MKIAAWNLNNRAGYVPFHPEAARAATALGAEVIVFTEYYPKSHHQEFVEVLRDYGWQHQIMSHEPTELANRVLVAARFPIEPDQTTAPDFDQQQPANYVAFRIPSTGLRVVGVRVPWYVDEAYPNVLKSWDWL